MARKVVLCTKAINDERFRKIQAAAKGFEVVDLTDGYKDEDLSDCEVIFGAPGRKMLAETKNLKWLHTQSAGIEPYIGADFMLREDVVLTNSAGAYGIGISEHLLTTAMMLLRRMGEYGRLQAESEWKVLGTVKTMYNSLVTVVGLGDIGGSFAQRCKSLGAKVRGVVRTKRDSVPDCVGELYTVDRLDEAIKDADIVALAMPGTKETAHMFDKNRMLGMKPGAIILNVGRGSAIDQDALIELLESGHIGGAGLDVMTPEPLTKDSKLWAMQNVVITPHVSGGWSLDLTIDLIVDRFVSYLEDYAAGRPFKRVVDRKAGY